MYTGNNYPNATQKEKDYYIQNNMSPDHPVVRAAREKRKKKQDRGFIYFILFWAVFISAGSYCMTYVW